MVHDPQPDETEIAAAAAGAEPAGQGGDRPQALLPAARRALAEAEARRAATGTGGEPPREEGGRGGPDPTRYGDWEVHGKAVDF